MGAIGTRTSFLLVLFLFTGDSLAITVKQENKQEVEQTDDRGWLEKNKKLLGVVILCAAGYAVIKKLSGNKQSRVRTEDGSTFEPDAMINSESIPLVSLSRYGVVFNRQLYKGLSNISFPEDLRALRCSVGEDFSGTVQFSKEQFPKLSIVFFEYRIPTLGSCPTIESLDMTRTRGAFPAELTKANFPKLTTINLSRRLGTQEVRAGLHQQFGDSLNISPAD